MDVALGASATRYPIAVDRVRFVGEAVVAVVAESREAATNGAEAVMVDFEDLPSVTDALQAIRPGAPVLCEQAPDNIAAEMRHGDAAAADAAFKRAAHVVSLDIVNQRLAPASMEPRVVLAEPDAASGRLTVTLSSQMPTAVRDGIAAALPGLAKEQVRVRVGDVGGGFGMKTGLYPEDIVVAHAARTLGRPVKWCAQRLEEFSASSHGRDLITRAELALEDNPVGRKVRFDVGTEVREQPPAERPRDRRPELEDAGARERAVRDGVGHGRILQATEKSRACLSLSNNRASISRVRAWPCPGLQASADTCGRS